MAFRVLFLPQPSMARGSASTVEAVSADPARTKSQF